jgi:hypothetical protein
LVGRTVSSGGEHWFVFRLAIWSLVRYFYSRRRGKINFSTSLLDEKEGAHLSIGAKLLEGSTISGATVLAYYLPSPAYICACKSCCSLLKHITFLFCSA